MLCSGLQVFWGSIADVGMSRGSNFAMACLTREKMEKLGCLAKKREDPVRTCWLSGTQEG